jgi:hypothetical protein
MSEKEEIPVLVELHDREGHRTETRVYARTIQETWCRDPACDFFGKPAVQGVCHTTEPSFEGGYTYWKLAEKYADESLHEIQKRYKGKSHEEYVEEIESSYICWMINATSMMDELIHLRRTNARLALENEKLRGQKV